MTIAAVVLAAGASRRLGQPKQLVAPWGRPLVRMAAEESLASTCDRVVVVLGAHESKVRRALEKLSVELETNSSWEEGMASSVRCGVSWAARARCDAVVLVACDQPALTAAHLDRLVRAHHAGSPVVGSGYDGTLGVPALFHRSTFRALLALRGHEGAKGVLFTLAASAVAWPEGAIDVDTPEDLARLAGAGGRGAV